MIDIDKNRTGTPTVKAVTAIAMPLFLRRGAWALVLGSLLAAGNVGSAQADGVRLEVLLTEVSEAGGKLRASLYRDPDSFRKEERAVKIIVIPAVKGASKIVFDDVAPARYAIMVYHDENGDEKLNLRFGMFPTEGYGLSNNPSVVGPPKFADSAFDVSGPETSTAIRLSY